VTIFDIAYESSIFTFQKEPCLYFIHSVLIINTTPYGNRSNFLLHVRQKAELLYLTEQSILLLDHWTTTVITSLAARSPTEYIISTYNTLTI